MATGIAQRAPWLLIALLIALLARRWELMYAVFALAAIGRAAQIISMRNFIYGLAEDGMRPTYIALTSTVSAPFVLGFAWLSGWLVERFGFAASFGVAGTLLSAALVTLLSQPLRPPAISLPCPD